MHLASCPTASANRDAHQPLSPFRVTICPFRHKKRRSAFLQSRHNQDTSNHFEKLRGNLEDFHSIRVNKQWRLVFEWDGVKR
jgi:RelE-like toxin of type II toxin-antitoxin system HigB